MKNQYFGDNRDLLKFDLVSEIVHKGLVTQFVYVPMLTENEGQKEEPSICRHEATGGSDNKGLLNFLDECIINEKRDIGQLEGFFHSCGIKATVYGKDKIFTHEERQAYFNGITKNLLTAALILVDPDKGLDEETNGAGNLLYTDIKKLYDRMDDESILMFTQRFPDELHEEYLGIRVAQIKEYIHGCQPISLDDLDTIIFFMTKSQVLQGRLMQLLGEYIGKYAQQESCGGSCCEDS